MQTYFGVWTRNWKPIITDVDSVFSILTFIESLRAWTLAIYNPWICIWWTFFYLKKLSFGHHDVNLLLLAEIEF